MSEGVSVKDLDAPSDEGLARSLQQERRLVAQTIAAHLESPTVREAIFLASPNLAQNLERWRRGEQTLGDTSAVISAAYRYLARMSTRTTPFGLFAGSSLGRVSGETGLSIAPATAYLRHTSLDNSYLFLLMEAFRSRPEYRRSAPCRPNTSLYRVGNKIRYSQASIESDTLEMNYQLASVDASEAIDFVLDQARSGLTLAVLAERLACAHDLPREDAASFVEALIEHDILIQDLTLPVTGAEPLRDAIAQLDSTEEIACPAGLKTVAERLEALDAAGIGQPRRRYEEVVTELEALPVSDLEPSRIFQVDLIKPMVADSLGEDVISVVRQTVEYVYRVAPAPPTAVWQRRRAAFRARFGDEAVPLAVALDPDFGALADAPRIASEASALIANLTFDEGSDPLEPETGFDPGSSPRDAYLLQKLRTIWKRGELEWTLDDRDLEALEADDKPPLPNALSATFQLIAPTGDGTAGPEIVFESAVGPPAGRFLGRFAHSQPELERRLTALAQREAELMPEVLLAEVAHLPQSRAGNVVCRPVLRDYEIPYLGKSGVELDRQLTIDDLLLAVRDERFILWSRRLNRRVLPRLTCAHNISNNTVAVYRFLTQLQFQEAYSWLNWLWGPFKDAPRLPRVRVGSAVISRQTWTVPRRDLAALVTNSEARRYRAAQVLRRTYDMPRRVTLAEGDNRLPLDFENPISLQSLAELVKNKVVARFIELWPEPSQAGITGPEGRYAGTFVVPLLRSGPAETRPGPALRCPDGSPQTFPPGSERLQLRLEVGKSAADEVLLGPLSDALAATQSDGHCHLWYFSASTADDGWQLRLHLHGNGERLLTGGLPRLSRALRAAMSEGPLASWSVETAVHQPHRHGGERAAPLVHGLFWRDSVATLDLLRLLHDDDEEEELRWQLALLSVDRLFADLALELPARAEILAELKTTLTRALPPANDLEKALSQTFRNQRTWIETLLAQRRSEADEREAGADSDPVLTGTGPEDVFHRAQGTLRTRSEEVRRFIAPLRTMAVEDQLSIPWPDLVGRLARASAQRLLRGAPQAHELVVYELLRRTYRSQVGRGRAQRKSRDAREVVPS